MDRELYHINLQAVYDRFGEEPMTVGIKDVAEWLGIDCRSLAADQNFPLTFAGRARRVVKTALASWMTRHN